MEKHGSLQRLPVAVLLTSMALAGQDAKRPQGPAAPAAPLYRLAFDEWSRLLRSGTRLPDRYRPRELVRAGRLQRARPTAREQYGPQWQQLLADSAVARELLWRASAGRVGTFDIARIAEPAVAIAHERQLRELVNAAAWRCVEQQPERAAETAAMLLQHARHLACGSSTRALHASDTARGEAIALLRAAAAKIDRASHAELLERCRCELHHHTQSALTVELLQHVLLAEISPMMDLHRPRLRDMHQTLPEGYDERAMRQQIASEIAAVFAACHHSGKQSLEQWGTAMQERLRELRRPPDGDATITNKAARGMAYNVLAALPGLLRQHRDRCDQLRRCLAELRD